MEIYSVSIKSNNSGGYCRSYDQIKPAINFFRDSLNSVFDGMGEIKTEKHTDGMKSTVTWNEEEIVVELNTIEI